jgi:hypothetical protein
MDTNMIPKFGKVELLIKNSDVDDLPSVTKIEFDDCGLMITGDYIIVVIDERDEIKNTVTSTGKIFNMREVQSYRTHKF